MSPLSAETDQTVGETVDETVDGESAPSTTIVPDQTILQDRYRILTDRPLAELDIPGASAFAVEDMESKSEQLFARITDPELYTRTDKMRTIRSMRDVDVIAPVQWGLVAWGSNADRRCATIFEQPDGPPLMASPAAQLPPMSTEEMSRRLLAPALRTLTQFAQRDVAHMAIRPDNIFVTASEDKQCVLGECVSAPAGWGQPFFLEPIERMMCDHDARGPGWIADDIYALGATLLVLALGYNPTVGMDEAALLQAKYEQGSYLALLQGARSPQGLRDPLRGMLADNLEERWAFEDLERWMSGTLRKSVQPVQEVKSDRSFTFAGTDFRACRMLAHSFGTHWPDAAEALRSAAFESWLKRGIADLALAEAIDEALLENAQKAGSPPAETKMVSRVCMLLDPAGPLRYRGKTLIATGVGSTLALALRRGDEDGIKLLTGCLNSGLAKEWITLQRAAGRYDGAMDDRAFSRAVQALRKQGPGFGVERCVYELDRNVPCMSPILGRHQVIDIRDLLPTLEAIVAADGRLSAMIESHIAAYIAAHLKANIDHHLADIDSATGQAPTAKLGMLKILSLVQEAHGPRKVTHLSQWIARELQPLISEFRGRTHREKIDGDLNRLASTGNLPQLYQLLGNAKVRRQDETGFAQAVRRYAYAGDQIKLYRSPEYFQGATKMGRGIAIRIGTIASIATIIVVAVI